MISFLKEPYKADEVEKMLNPLVKKWFFSKFKEFSLPQLYVVKEIHEKSNILLSAPTGGTKTLSSTMAILNELVNLAMGGALEKKVYCVYVNPLKALSRDIEVNLKQPLEEIKELCKKEGKEINIRIGVRTGDTTPAERQKLLKNPPHILITTPESLSLMLVSPKFKLFLQDVQYCIIDEIHALAENKRGVHLSVTLESLQHISTRMQRIGLSATIAPLEEIAQFLVGTNRNCKIADVRFVKQKDFQIISPVPDLIETTFKEQHDALYSILDKLVQEHRTTIIFTNTRSATERVINHLKERFPRDYLGNIGAHHGSLGKTYRHNIEDRMRKGELKACVSSTSLELGLDIGYIDLVICLGSPKSIARLAQRFGRAGHRLHDTVKGRIVVLDRDDLIECSIMLKDAIENKIDRIHIPENCLDVVTQHVHGMAVSGRWNVKDIFTLIKQSYCYRNLEKNDLLDVIKYLAGVHVSLEDRHVYAKIWYDEQTQEIGKKGRMSRVIHMTNIGTIPDETSVIVKTGEQVIGTLDEGFLERLHRGDIFVLGGETYEFLFSRGMVAQVKSAQQKAPTVPSWFSEMLPLSFDLAINIQKFRRYIEDLLVNKKSTTEILRYIKEYLYVDDNAAKAIYRYCKEQYLYAQIPHDKRLLIEQYTDEKGKTYVIFHALYGRRVNDCLSRALAYAIGKIQHRDVEIGINDNGFYLASTKNIQASRALELLDPKELRKVLEQAIEKTEVLKRRFRHCATRSLMILREYKGQRKHVGRQQVSSMILMSALKQLNNNFPILKEARREVLEDLMDIENATKVLKEIKEGKIEVTQIHTTIPSPFACNVVTQGYTDVLKMENKVEFLRRMHQQILAKIGKKHDISDLQKV